MENLTQAELNLIIAELEAAIPLHEFTIGNPAWRYTSTPSGLETIKNEYRLRIDLIRSLLPKLAQMAGKAQL